MQIVEQGFIKPKDNHYFLGVVTRNSDEKVPIVATKKGNPIFCAYVTFVDTTTYRYKYFNRENIPEEVFCFMKKHDYIFAENG